jgi:hypothetical protein
MRPDAMSEIAEIFESLIPEVEKELKPKLNSILLGSFIRGYLPQRWVFKTEKETVTFSVDKKGNATVKEGEVDDPDVKIELDHEFLVEALKTRTQPEGDPEKKEFKFLTTKGETAFNLLKKRFGL